MAKYEIWYQAKSQSDRAKLLCAHVDGLRRGPLSNWRRELLHRQRLYSGRWKLNASSSCTDASTRFNLVRMCCDTALSILGAARTLPFTQTRGAEWDVRRTAMRRTRAMQTQFARIGVFERALEVMLDAVVCGLGALKFVEDEDRGGLVGVERVLPASIVWDPAETVTGDPRTVFHVNLVNREQLRALYPSKQSMIAAAATASDIDRDDFQLDTAYGCDLVVVIEAWKLPSATGATDGLHCIATSRGMLFEEDWRQPRPPLAFMRGWQPNQLGFPGCSITELVEEAQRRCDELREFVTDCQHLASGPVIVLNGGAGIAETQPEELTNMPVKVFRNMGDQPPTLFTFDGTPQDLQAQYAMIREETLAMLGFNAAQAQGAKPSGLSSGAALRAQEDIQSKRHILMLRHLESGLYLQAAHCLSDANDRLAERAPGYQIERETRARWLASSKWSELSLGEEEATWAVLPVSSLVGSVAAQHDTVANWVNQGWCDAATAKQLEQHPDTEAEVDEENAALELARDHADEVLDGAPAELDPLVPPQAYLDAFLPAYYAARRGGAPDDVLDQMRIVIDQAKAAVDVASAPPPAPPGAPSVAPPAPEGMLPQ